MQLCLPHQTNTIFNVEELGKEIATPFSVIVPKTPNRPRPPQANNKHQVDPIQGGSLFRWMNSLKNDIIRQEVLLVDGS